MSRIGIQPIVLPPGVEVRPEEGRVVVSGPQGTLAKHLPPEVAVTVEGERATLRLARSSRRGRALWGLARALLAGMVQGVSRGFEKKLELEGIGYRAQIVGQDLEFSLGFSHPVRLAPPPGVTFRVEKNVITVAGIDREAVGDAAARIRRLRPPEPYKGKGIRYAGEVIRRKAGKKAVSAAGG